MQGDDGLGTGFGGEEGYVGVVVHIEVLGQDGRAEGVAEDVEVLLQVGVAIGKAGAELHARKESLGGIIEARGQGICARLARRGVAAPSAGVEPVPAVSGGIDVERQQDHLVTPELVADSVDTAAALGKGDVFPLGHQVLSVQPPEGELLFDAYGEVARVGVFAEVAVGAALARGVEAVAVVDKDSHGSHLDCDCKLNILCGNNNCANFPLSLCRMFLAKDIYYRDGLGTCFERVSRPFSDKQKPTNRM